MRYNGWTNRETWLVNLWFEPQNVEDLEYAKGILESEYGVLPGYLQDMCYIEQINWEELKAHFEEEKETLEASNV